MRCERCPAPPGSDCWGESRTPRICQLVAEGREDYRRWVADGCPARAQAPPPAPGPATGTPPPQPSCVPCRGGLYGGRVGSLLARVMHMFNIEPTPECRCEERAAAMDAWGPAGCLEHLEEIVGWLREAATARDLPFPESGVRLALRAMIAVA